MTVTTLTNGVDRVPYVGVRPFRSEENAHFYGRDREGSAVAGLWRGNPLTLLTGAAGTGKTSLISADLLARIESAGEVLPVGRLVRPASGPIAALPAHNPYSLALLSSWFPAEYVSTLAGRTLADLLRRRYPQTARSGGRPAFAVIDQGEQLFDAVAREAERSAFLAELAEALDQLPGLRLLVAVRDEHADGYRGADAAVFTLRPFDREAATEAVRRPALAAGRPFEEDAADVVVSGVSGAAATVIEPVLLQVGCSRLWSSLPRATPFIGRDDVTRHADFDRWLTDFCGEAVARTAMDHGVEPGLLLSWLRRASGLTLRSAIEAGIPARALRALEDRHVLKAGDDGYRLQHERLAGPLRGLRASDLGPPPATTGPEQLMLATQALADDDFAQARRHAEGALRLSGDDLRARAEAESALGDIAFLRGDHQAAEAHYETAAEFSETFADPQVVSRLLAAIGRTMLAQEREAEAVNRLRAAVRRQPGDLTFQIELGRALSRSGQRQTAVAVLSDVLATNGDTPDALQARGELFADLGQATEALRDLDRVRSSGRPIARAARALALATLRDHSAAHAEIDAALADAPGNGPVLLYVARALELEGDRAAATELAHRAGEATDPPLSRPQRAEVQRLLRPDPDAPSA
ncbi:MAG TPA: AAA family ATPase [Actinoallomurus sp.]|nr:AAA family ATPase [Actinoallomurus sp.]